jgi:hypothetical protein
MNPRQLTITDQSYQNVSRETILVRSGDERITPSQGAGLVFWAESLGSVFDEIIERFGRLFVAMNNAETEGHCIDSYQPPINILASLRSSS